MSEAVTHQLRVEGVSHTNQARAFRRVNQTSRFVYDTCAAGTDTKWSALLFFSLTSRLSPFLFESLVQAKPTSKIFLSAPDGHYVEQPRNGRTQEKQHKTSCASGLSVAKRCELHLLASAAAVRALLTIIKAAASEPDKEPWRIRGGSEPGPSID